MSKIGQASRNEAGTFKTGKPGDQTGKEVYTRSWYSYPWIVVLRPKSAAMRKRYADGMRAACGNERIGYGQNTRNGLMYLARRVGYDPAKIMEPCNCDCSSLVAVLSCYAGIDRDVVYKQGNCFTTATLREALTGTGLFEELTDQRYLTSPDCLLEGDILLARGHVAVNLEDGKSAGKSATAWPTLRRGSRGEAVRVLQRRLNELGNSLAVDGAFGPATEAAVFWFQRANGLEDDGICGPRTWAALENK